MIQFSQDMGSAAQILSTTSIDNPGRRRRGPAPVEAEARVSPYVIHQDVDGFKNEYQVFLASNLIQDNGHLDAESVESHGG